MKKFLKDYTDIPIFSIVTMICDDFKVSGEWPANTALCNGLPGMEKAIYKLAERSQMEWDDEKKKAMIQAKKDNADYEVIDEIPWWSNGGGFTNKVRTRLFIYDMEKDELTPLTEPLFNLGSMTVCEKEQKIKQDRRSQSVAVPCHLSDSAACECFHS